MIGGISSSFLVIKVILVYSDLCFNGITIKLGSLIKSHGIDMGFVRTPFNNNRVNAIYFDKEPMYAVGKNIFYKITFLHQLTQYYDDHVLIIEHLIHILVALTA